MVAVLAVSLSLDGCAATRAGQSAQRAPAAPSAQVVPVSHLRRVGPDDDGRQVVLRFGDQLQVTPPESPAGWTVVTCTSDILRLLDGNGAADSHTFLAIAVGDCRLSLAPAGPQVRPTGAYALRIRVLRDVIQPPQS